MFKFVQRQENHIFHVWSVFFLSACDSMCVSSLLTFSLPNEWSAEIIFLFMRFRVYHFTMAFFPEGLLTCFHRFQFSNGQSKFSVYIYREREKSVHDCCNYTVNVNDKWHIHVLSQQNIWWIVVAALCVYIFWFRSRSFLPPPATQCRGSWAINVYEQKIKHV